MNKPINNFIKSYKKHTTSMVGLMFMAPAVIVAGGFLASGSNTPHHKDYAHVLNSEIQLNEARVDSPKISSYDSIYQTPLPTNVDVVNKENQSSTTDDYYVEVNKKVTENSSSPLKEILPEQKTILANKKANTVSSVELSDALTIDVKTIKVDNNLSVKKPESTTTSADVLGIKTEKTMAPIASIEKASIEHKSSIKLQYPSYLANAPQDSIIDSWGLYNRECVSYAAFMVASSGRHMPNWSGRGNANEWLGNAIGAGIPTGNTPKQGAIAVWNDGYYGHVAHVDIVHPDGSITISEYNFGTNGSYGERTLSASDPSAYIYF